jgi:GntR family transcriptional regulator, arabinose operon transcriptional repressor
MSTNAMGRSKPRYTEIQEILTRELLTGGFQPHEHFGTLNSVCERFDTSKITAQRALMEMVRKGLLYTKRGGGAFVAPERKPAPSQLLSFFFDSFVSDGALPLVIHGAEDAARESGYSLVLCNAQADPEISRQNTERMLAQKVGGVLYDFVDNGVDYEHVHEVLDRFESVGVPVVLVQRRLLAETRPMSYVTTDNYGGTVKAVDHLVRLGHRRIAGIHEVCNSAAIERCEGYRGAILMFGAVFHESLIKTMRSLEDCDTCVAELLSLECPPTAIVCEHDLVARTVMQSLQSRGVVVPDGMAVVGFDDLPFSQYLLPPLTTVRQPLEAVGREAFNLLLKRMTVDFNAHEQVRLETELVVRESSGGPLADAPLANDATKCG